MRRCLEEGIGCYLSRSDLKAAFRMLGIKPEHWHLLLMWARSPLDGQWYFFVDKCLPFGSSISCAHFQSFSNALAHIVRFRTHRKPTNYLDDFLFAALLKMVCNQQVKVFLWLCEQIRLPVSFEKTFWGSTKLTFLGLLLDMVKQLVCLPAEKIHKAILLIEKVKGNRKITVHNLQKLCGFLNFLCRAIVPGRAFTRRLYAYTSGGKSQLKPHHHIRITAEMRADLEMWLVFLNHPTAYCRSFMDFKEVQADEVRFYSDASGNFELGFGGYCNVEWVFGRWDSFTARVKPSIEYLELFALAVNVLLWIHKFRNRRIRVFCDNISVVYMINNSSSSCKNCMVLIRIITLECLIQNVRLFAKHVPMDQNGISDALSRMEFSRFSRLAAEADIEFKDEPCNIPEKIWPISKIWIE